jgi:hypothetical protein
MARRGPAFSAVTTESVSSGIDGSTCARAGSLRLMLIEVMRG